MGKINTEDLQPGMVLADAVKNHTGMVILSAGSEITGKHIRVFKSWGITEVDIEGVDQDDLTTAVTARIDLALRQKAEAVADDLFRYNQRNHPAVDRLYHLFILRYVKQRETQVSHGS